MIQLRFFIPQTIFCHRCFPELSSAGLQSCSVFQGGRFEPSLNL